MRTLTLCSIAALLLLPFAPPVRAEEETADVAKSVRAYFAAKAPSKRAEIALRLTLHGAAPKAVLAATRKARTWPSAEEADAGHVAGWKRETTVADTTRSHSIFARIPKQYAPDKAWPVVLWLHGGVRRDSDGGGAFGANALGDRADAHGFIVLSPSVYGGVAWWTAEGVELVRGALEDAKARWHIDANRVFVTGFSDGGSGCFHLLAHDPDPYAAFLPMMGHPAFTRMFGGPTYVANVASRPVFAVNGGRDELYPSASVKPLIDGLIKAGCDLTWKNLPEATHSLNHIAEVWDDLWAFAQAHPRNPVSAVREWVHWAGSHAGRLDWVEILRVDAGAPGRASLGPRELGLRRRVVLGVRLDLSFGGPGLRVGTVEAGTAAADAGVLDGDVITAVDGLELGALGVAVNALRKALTLSAGGSVKTLELAIDRDGGSIKVSVTARVPKAAEIARPATLGYGVPTARIRAHRTSASQITIDTFHVGAFRLHLSAGLIDLGKLLEVVVNGEVRYQGIPKQSVAYLLGEARRGGGAKPHNVATLLLRP